MNYTGRPSISGCRPVLSLYPTHCFCQYLLGIFITFTNSSLFCRAFSTNSRRLLRHAAGGTEESYPACQWLPLWGRSSTSPSLLRNATSPTEGRPWHSGKLLLFARGSPTRGAVERSETERLYEGEPDREALAGLNLSVTADAVPPPLPRGGLGSPRKVNGSARGSPTRGAVERSETERLYEGEPFLCRKVRLAASFPVSFWRIICYNGFVVHPAYLTGEEVDALAYFLTFLVSVGADVVSHFICKWLDSCEENRKA